MTKRQRLVANCSHSPCARQVRGCVGAAVPQHAPLARVRASARARRPPLATYRHRNCGWRSSPRWRRMRRRSTRSSATTLRSASRRSSCTSTTRRTRRCAWHGGTHPAVVVRVRDDALRREWRDLPSWARLELYADSEVQARQQLNCEHAARAAAAAGADYLLHVDSDELLYFPRAAARARGGGARRAPARARGARRAAIHLPKPRGGARGGGVRRRAARRQPLQAAPGRAARGAAERRRRRGRCAIGATATTTFGSTPTASRSSRCDRRRRRAPRRAANSRARAHSLRRADGAFVNNRQLLSVRARGAAQWSTRAAPLRLLVLRVLGARPRSDLSPFDARRRRHRPARASAHGTATRRGLPPQRDAR